MKQFYSQPPRGFQPQGRERQRELTKTACFICSERSGSTEEEADGTHASGTHANLGIHSGRIFFFLVTILLILISSDISTVLPMSVCPSLWLKPSGKCPRDKEFNLFTPEGNLTVAHQLD